MNSKDKQQEMFEKGKKLVKPEDGWLIDPNVSQLVKIEEDPYDMVNTTPCHNFKPFMKNSLDTD
jgi:hypothetical protein